MRTLPFHFALLPALLALAGCFSEKTHSKAKPAAVAAVPLTPEGLVAANTWCVGNAFSHFGEPSSLTRYRFRKQTHSMVKDLVRAGDNWESSELTVYPKSNEVENLTWRMIDQKDPNATFVLELKLFDRQEISWQQMKSLDSFEAALQPVSEPKHRLEISVNGKDPLIAYACSAFPGPVAGKVPNRTPFEEQVRKEMEFRFISLGEHRPEQIVMRKQLHWPLAEIEMPPAEIAFTTWCRAELHNGKFFGYFRALRFLDAGVIDHKRVTMTPEVGGNYEITNYPFISGATWVEQNGKMILQGGPPERDGPVEIHIMKDYVGQKILTTTTGNPLQLRPGEVFVDCEDYKDKDEKYHFLDLPITAEDLQRFLSVTGREKIPTGWR